MSNGDKHYKHMVVRVSPHGFVVCSTAAGEPGVYHDTPPAELHAAQLREKEPGCAFRVISFQVL